MEPDVRDDPAVREALRAIAAGEGVDWAAVDHAVADESSRQFIRGLRAVAGIADFHRGLQTTGAQALAARPGAPAIRDGSTWGALTILDRIGNGAFGHVYRAWDPRLDREVALKILTHPDAAADSNSAVAVEEARLLARLRHPNIVAVHGADCVEGKVGLWMELLSGVTLDQLVQDRGPLGAEEALLVGRDVCRAVAAIHRAGLLHRDIKAQNVMRERGGRVVLMDFGAGREAVETRSGGLAGTPLYLAPEILAGLPATAQTDLYSVGVLLYFLVSGSFPVAADTIVALRAAHAAGQRTRLRDARPDLPARFIQVVDQSMSADPRDRFDSAGAMEVALSDTLGRDERGPVARSAWQPRLWVTVVAAATAVIALGLAAWGLRPQAPETRAVTRLVQPVDGERVFSAAISPDGSQLVYEVRARDTTTHLHRRALNDFTATIVPGTESASGPFFSNDGRSVAFQHVGAPQALRKISLAGGPPVTLVETDDIDGGDWAADGTMVYSSHGDLWRLPDSAGTPTRLTRMGAGGRALQPQVLPDGSVLFTRTVAGGADELALLSRSGSISTLMPNATNGRYVPTGYLVFVRGAWIMAAPFDAGRLKATGPPVQIEPRGFGSGFAVSRTGTLVYSSIGQAEQAVAPPRFVWIDRRTGREEMLPFPPQHYLPGGVRLSPDGRKVAVAVSSGPPATAEAEPGRLWVGDIATGTLTPLTSADAHPIAWTRDSVRLVFFSKRGALLWRRADGAAAEEELAGPENFPMGGCSRGAWSVDGRTLILRCWATGMGGDLLAVTLAPAGAAGPRATVTPFVSTPFGEGYPTVSPDGRWVAFQSSESGQQEIWAKSFPAGPVRRISTGGGNTPFWRGNELFYLLLSPRVPMVLPVLRTSPSLEFGEARRAVDRFDYAEAGGFDVSPDGQRFLVLKGARPPGATQLNVIVNWMDEVARKVRAPR